MRQKNRDTMRIGRGFERLEDRRLLAGLVTQLGYFDTWDEGVIPSTDPGGIAYYAPSGNLYLADTEINENPEFQGNNIFEISLAGDQLFQEIASGHKEPTGITYNEFDGFFYITNDDNDTIQRFDTNLNNPLATIFTTVDVPNAFDVEGITSDPSTGNLFVIDGNGGGIQVLVYDSDLRFEYSFPVSAQLSDAEGIAFNPDNNRLYIVSEADDLIAEYALNGTFVEQYDTSGLTPNSGSLQGLTFAPTSDPLDDPNNLALYIADGGVDNFPDGGVYEVSLSDAQLAQNTAPLVNAGGTQDLLLASFPMSADLNAAVADDGLPNPPGTMTTLWSQVSGPAAVSFADATVVDPTVTFSAAGTYVLRLTADDGNLITSDDTTIVVKRGVQIRITTSSDDAEERIATGGVFLTGADLDLGTDAGSTSTFDQLVGLRFPNVVIPQGALITTAYIQFRADETDAIATSLTIVGEDIDDAPTFSSANGDLSSRSTTLPSVVWAPAPWTKGDDGLDQRTPDISTVIQDLVNRPGWSINNALAIILSGTGERVAEPYDGNVPMFAPLLRIEFITPGVTINQGVGSTDITEGGTTDTYDVVLDSPPQTGTTVTITLGTTDGQTTTNPTSLVFDENDWNTPQTVTVTAVDDSLQEGSPHSGTITHTASSADPDYNGISIGNVTANITDNDTPGVTIVESGGSTDITEDGPTDSYDVVLDSPPQTGTTVTITLDTTDGQTSANPTSLIFSESDWNTPQTVTVTAVDDDLAEGSPHTGSITHAASSADIDYNGIGINSVTANITDNDVAGVTIIQSAAGGGAAASNPTIVEVQVAASSDDAEQRFSGVVKFTSKDLELVDDPTQSGVQQTVGLRFDGLTIPQGAVITDAYVQFEASGIDIVATVLQFNGEDTDNAATFTTTDFNISSRQATNATVAWAVPDWTTIGEAGANQQTPNIASVIQEIVDRAGWVAGNAMALIITGIGERTAVSYDGDVANGTSGAPVLHVEYTTNVSVDVVEGGATDTYDIVLDSQPKPGTTVTIMLGMADGQTTTNPTSLVFDENDWSIPQTVTVTAVDDSFIEGSPHSGTITHTATSADSDYNGIVINDVDANITDNDTPGVTITESGGSTDLSEDGLTDTYEVVLDSSPQAGTTVTIIIGTADGQTTVAPTSLVLSDSDWNIPQTVIVTEVDDSLAESSPHNGVITHAAISVDGNFNGIGINSVTANITDNDEASDPVIVEVRITTSADDAEERIATGRMFLSGADLDFGVDAGGSTTYDQLVGMRFGGLGIPTGATIINAYIQFRADETDSVATSLTIRAEDTDNPLAFTAATGNLSSRSLTTSSVAWSPPAWTKNGVGLDQRTPDLATVVQDIVNRPGWTSGNALAIMISGTGERVAEPYDGNVPLFAPLLHVEFSVPAVQTIQSSTVAAPTTTNLSNMVFDESNWNIPQTVTVTAEDDSFVEGSPHSGNITHTATSADPGYDGIAINDVDANITDNDVFTVNSLADTVDANLGDGLAEDALGNTTLRAAIMEANAISGAITIILPSGVYNNSGGQYEITDTTGSITIVGAGASTTTITGANRAFNIQAGATLNVSDITMTGAGGAQDGGGIFNQGILDIQSSTLENYSAIANGGGIYNATGGVVSITDSTIANNSAPDQGGGIYNDNSILTVTRSTFSGNATGNGPTQGGGAIWTSGIVVISNSTISNNTTSDSGGIFSSGLANVTISNSTITENSAGIRHDATGTFSITNSVIAGNVTDFTGSGTFTSGGFNLIGDVGSALGFVDGVNGDQVGSTLTPIDPLLGPLQNNGGPTLTHMILAGSPLINAGDPSFVLPPDFDQRSASYDRKTFGQIDIGAVELDSTSNVVSADFDGDTFVGGIDFLSWQRGFGSTSGAASEDGDATGDGKVTGGDLAVWEDAFGAAPAFAVVAELGSASSADEIDEPFVQPKETSAEESVGSTISTIFQAAANIGANYDGLLTFRDISFASIRDSLSHEIRSAFRQRDLSRSHSTADEVFADYANRHRIFGQEEQRNLAANFDNEKMTLECPTAAAQCHVVDNVYDQLGNSFTELDDLGRNGRSIWESRPIKRRRT